MYDNARPVPKTKEVRAMTSAETTPKLTVGLHKLTRRALLSRAGAIGVSACAAPVASFVAGNISAFASTQASKNSGAELTAQTKTSDQKNSKNILDIKRNGSQPSTRGRSEWFTGEVRIDQPFEANEPARIFGATVSFEPGARTAWHTHPLGQTLFVTFGLGWAQLEGGPVEEIRPGDVVWIDPGKKHWHGATPTTPMTHIAVVEKLNGKTADWLEKVTEEQYRR
jgi:quercetin dioxygenase-like cupin family protein